MSRVIRHSNLNVRVTEDLKSVLVEASKEIECSASWLARRFIAEGAASVLTDESVKRELRQQARFA